MKRETILTLLAYILVCVAGKTILKTYSADKSMPPIDPSIGTIEERNKYINPIFHVLHDSSQFRLKDCMDYTETKYLVASYKNTDGIVMDVSKLTFAESRNALLIKSLSSGVDYDYYCFIDGDIQMTCKDLDDFIARLGKSRVPIAHPYYPYWGIKRCNCSYCGILHSDASFQCYRKDMLKKYFPMNTYCDEYNWGMILMFIHQEMLRNGDFYHVDPLSEYTNPRHEKTYGNFNKTCISQYYQNNHIEYSEENVVIPWDVRLTQGIKCVE
jgi:hypothetical protein